MGLSGKCAPAEANTVHMNTLLGACARRGKWLMASGLLNGMVSQEAELAVLGDL